MTTFVSLSGAYLKASHVPKPGTLLTLVERFNSEGIEINLRGEVMWCQDEPTLERPETGFGIRFIELATRADPGHLEDFLKALDPTRPVPAITFEERANGAHAVYRFPIAELEPDLYREEEPGFAELDEPIIVDLDRELDRLSREDRRAPSSDLLPPPLPEPPPSPRSETPLPLANDARAARQRKRSVTGIFTALFSRGAKLDDLGVDASEATPAISEGTLIHDARRPKMLLSWAGGSVVARIESLGRQGATLWSNDAAPEPGEEVTLRPAGGVVTFELAILGKVLSREDRARSGVSWLSLTFLRVDEHGRAGRFQEYLRYVNGPGADER